MGFIYIVSATNGYVKIGHSQLPIERFTTLQNGSPLPLTLEYVCECSQSLAAETAIHKVLAPFHRHREWFELATVDAIAATRKAIAELCGELTTVPHIAKQRGAHARIIPRMREAASP